MGSDDVFAITSRGDDIWFGNYAGGLHHLAPDGSITHYGHDPDNPGSLPSDTVMSLVFDRTGTLWIGTLAGLAKFQDGRIERVAMPAEGTPRRNSTVLDGDDLGAGPPQGPGVRTPAGRL